MKTYALSILTVFTLVALGPARVHAYANSQEEQWHADLIEARGRARDFQKHLERLRNADRIRESAANEIKIERRRDEEREERARRKYIKERNSKPSTELVELQLEREHLKKQAAEAREAEKVRAGFAAKRDRMEHVMHQEAYINPAREYDVRSARPVTEQMEINKAYSQPLLNLNIKSGSDSNR